ncbi:hypothetical protein LCGC14_0575650 [marine sediment metagenome]|uniref:Uncharacterized protein n=1 Tax=marine sediment metagenome TaxID=412755 RepID=A0A0F9S1E5_9ZZZZ
MSIVEEFDQFYNYYDRTAFFWFTCNSGDSMRRYRRTCHRLEQLEPAACHECAEPLNLDDAVEGWDGNLYCPDCGWLVLTVDDEQRNTQ